MCVAGFPAVLHDGQNAWGAFAILSLQTTTDVFGIWGKALRRGHDPVEVHWEALWARGAGTTGGKRFSRGNFGRSVIVTVGSR